MGKSFFYSKLAMSNIKKNRRFYLPYLLSAVGTIMMFYIICALSHAINTDKTFGGSTLIEMLNLGKNVIAIFAVIFIFYTNSFVIKRRKKELGLYSVLGMEKRHISRVISLETIVISIASLIGGIVLGIVFSKLMFLILEAIIRLEGSITFSISFPAITLTLTVFAAIFLLTLIYNLIQILKAKPVELLHGGEVGEKEPKSNWLLAAIGVICLGIGYYMAVTITDPVAAILFFMVAVILVIIGTYCIFIFAITVVLKLLKKNKNFYYKTTHFTAISGMLYRMKQNAAGLATICILSTCVLVMIGTTISLFTSIESVVDNRYPYEVNLTAYENNSGKADEIHDAIIYAAETSGVKINESTEALEQTSMSLRDGNRFHKDGSGEQAILTVVGNEDFGKYYGQSLSIEDNEVIIISNSDIKFDTWDILGIELKNINSTLPEDFNIDKYGTYSAYIAEHFFIIVSQNTLEKISNAPDNSYSRYYSFAFNTDSSLESQKEFAVNLSESMRLITDDDNFNLSLKEQQRGDVYQMYGGLFFLGTFLGITFMMALVLIIYYKQISEGYEDKTRFDIMQQVGMSHKEVKASIHSQILMVFFVPLITAIIHLVFATPMLIRILVLLNLTDTPLILFSLAAVVAVFSIVYVIVYRLTARSYYKISQS